MSKFPFITPDDILPYVNNELASLGIGASVGTLHLNKNIVHCTSKKYKGNIAVFVNEDNWRAGSVSGFCITSLKDNGAIKISKAVRDILGTDNRKLPSRSYEDIEKARQKAEFDLEVQKRNSERALQKVLAEYQRASENGVCAYFQRKNVKAYAGVRFNRDGAIVPLCGYEGGQLKIRSAQRITADSKKNANGLSYSKLFFPIGNRQNPSNIYFCEGYATASTIYESISNKNNSLVVMCVNSTNLPKVVDIFAEKYNDVCRAGGFTVCADNDMWKEPRSKCFAGFKSAATVATKWDKVLITYPLFSHDLLDIYQKYSPDPTKKFEPTDFNDQAFFDTVDVESVRFSAHEFLTQVYDIKNNSVVDYDKQQALVNLKWKAHQFNKFTTKLLDNQYVANELVAISKLWGELSNLPRINHPELIAIADAARPSDHTTVAPLLQKSAKERAQLKQELQLEKQAIKNELNEKLAALDALNLKPKERAAARREMRNQYRTTKVTIAKYALNPEFAMADPIANAKACYLSKFTAPHEKIATGAFREITTDWVDVPYLNNGDTSLLYLPMGSGKTTWIINQVTHLISKFLDTEQREPQIAVIAPLKSLVAETVRKLNDALKLAGISSQFQSYEVLKKNGGNSNLLVTTVHSARHFDMADYDLVIIDELHDVRRRFDNGMKDPSENYYSFLKAIATAKRFIGSDAFLTQRDVDFINELRGQSTLFYKMPTTSQILYILYETQKEVTQKAIDLAKSGQYFIFPVNSRAYAKQLEEAFDLAGIKFKKLVIYEENTGETEQSAFLDNPNAEIDNYQVIVYTPVISGGVSFDATATRKPRVILGYFTSKVGIASDAHQMLGRYRLQHGEITEYHICLDAPKTELPTISAQEKAITTEAKEIYERSKRRGEFKLSIDELRQMLTANVENDAFSKFKFALRDEIAIYQAQYFDDFITQAIAMGGKVTVAGVQVTDETLEILKNARQVLKDTEIANVRDCNNTTINQREYDEIENASRVTKKQYAQKQHFDYSRFTAKTEPLTDDEIEFLNSKGMARMGFLESSNCAFVPIWMQQSDEQVNLPLSERKTRLSRHEVAWRAVAAAGLEFDENGALVQTSESATIDINSKPVQDFFSWVWTQRHWINALSLPNVAKITDGFNKDFKWLNTLLSAMGIELLRKKVRCGNKFLSEYHIDIDHLDFINSILKRRFEKIHKPRLEEIAERAESDKNHTEYSVSTVFSIE